MRVPGGRGAISAALLCGLLTANPAAADEADVLAATYGNFSVSAPTTVSLIVCHGFDCSRRTELGLNGKDRAHLAQLMAAGRASPEAERRAIAAAGAWFDRRVAPLAGTKGHVARAGAKYMNDPGQFDCIDTSRNMTSLLLVLDQLKLLHHHRVASPESRGFIINGQRLHNTAVIVEKASGEKWSVDAWTRAYGQAPEIMKLAVWKTLD